VGYALLFMGVGALLGYFLVPEHDRSSSKQIREMGEFSFINPLLECEVGETAIGSLKQNFRADLEDEANEIIREGGAKKLAVYYRDLNNGPAFGFQQEERFIPASLLKVPVMMAYYDLAEDQPDIFRKVIPYTEKYEIEGSSAQLILPDDELVVGQEYTVDELIRRAITQSDNQAVTALIEHIPPTYIRKLYRVLGVPEEVLNGPNGSLSVREYASFFRILFNSSYLDRRYSEEALKTLSETKFDRGIVAGVPEGTIVSHKFGESGSMRDHQIHDCGIVYHPRFPYLICVMSRGESIESLERAISRISRFIWGQVDENSPRGD
jgi:beta-lactamase class A